MQVISILGAGFAIFLFFLSLKNSSNISNKLFSFLLFSFSLHLSFYYLSIQYKSYHNVFFLRSIVPLLYGPLLYLYIGYYSKTTKHFLKKHYLHFLPFAASFLFLLYMLIFKSNSSYFTKGFELSFAYSAGKIIVISSALFYFLACFRSLARYKNFVTQQFSFTEKIDLGWIKSMLYSLFIAWVIIIVLVIMNRLHPFIKIEIERSVIYLILCCFVFYIGYRGIKQSNIFSDIKIPLTQIDELQLIKNENVISISSSEQPDTLSLYFSRIKQLVENEKLYLNPKLTISDIAQKLDINVNYISKSVNSVGQCNFFEFINAYRVNEFKTRVLKPENNQFTILSIALDSGFNSKASFNRIFKNSTGQTPNEFKNSKLQELRLPNS